MTHNTNCILWTKNIYQNNKYLSKQYENWLMAFSLLKTKNGEKLNGKDKKK